MGENNMKILVFELNGEHYATDIAEVERILGYSHPTAMPDVPDYVEGVINYEENILPIINLSKKFNLEASDEKKDRKIIVIKREEEKFGVVVDNVSEVSDIKDGSFEEAPEITVSISRRYIKGLIKFEKDITILLDMKEILTEEERKEIL